MSAQKHRTILVLSLYDYLNFFKFSQMDLKERVIHILYYVTEIANLRTDMTASIITQRLDDVKTVFLRNSVSKTGIDTQTTSYEQVYDILSHNEDWFTKLEEIDRRDRHPEDVAYSLNLQKRKELKAEMATLIEYVEHLNNKEEELMAKDYKYHLLAHELNNLKKREIRRKITYDYIGLVIIIVIVVLAICWTSASWNIIGRGVSTLLNASHPIRDNIIAAIIVSFLTSPPLVHRLRSNHKILKQLSSEGHAVDGIIHVV